MGSRFRGSPHFFCLFFFRQQIESITKHFYDKLKDHGFNLKKWKLEIQNYNILI